MASIEKAGDYTGAFPTIEHRTWRRLAIEWPHFATFGRGCARSSARSIAVRRRRAPARTAARE
jgi:hypothetical protein